MSSAHLAESTAGSLAAKLRAAHRDLSQRWLEELVEILPVPTQDVFPGKELLDHIPQIIVEIADYVKAPDGEPIATNSAVMAKAAELGQLRYQQRASVHQLLKEYHLLGSLLEQFITDEVRRMGPSADAVGSLRAVSRVSQAVRVLQQQTVDTFVGKYTETIETQTAQLRGFTRLVSHEIRQPLAVLQLISKLIPPGENQHARLVEMMGRNVSQLGDVARKLERLARLSRASTADSPTEQEVELSPLCRNVAAQLQDMAASRDVSVVIDDDLPTVITDAGRAELAIINLIANAIKYSDPHKPARAVRVRRTPGSEASIVIEDNGIGIAGSQVAVIFEEFVRAHSGRDDELGAQGLGLGLAIVRECIEVMKGSVTVTSEEGAGTAFTLTWPRREQPQAAG